jgi:mandelate racemase
LNSPTILASKRPASGGDKTCLALGLKALKLRLGNPTLTQDLAALDAVRNRAGTGVVIMVDYDQALTPADATCVSPVALAFRHRGR